MPDTTFTVPAVVRSGMVRKISESFYTLVDGQPSSRGMPMETEVRYYYNYYLLHERATFETFLSALSLDISKKFPTVNLTLEWIQRCDGMGRINSARNLISNLRNYIDKAQYFHTSFWDILWNLTEVYMKKFGVTCAEIGTTSQEIKSLSWSYLLKECKIRVKDL